MPNLVIIDFLHNLKTLARAPALALAQLMLVLRHFDQHGYYTDQ